MKRLLSTGAMVIVSLALARPLSAATINVPADQPTIQAAITVAAPGDLILVAPGTYVENLTLNKKLTLQGAGDGSNPLVDTILQPAAGTAILIQVGGAGPSDRCLIRDLRIASGTASALYTLSTFGYLTLQNLTLVGTGGGTGFEINNSANIVDMAMIDVDITGYHTGMRVRGWLNGLTMTGGHIDGNNYGLQSYTAVGEGNNFLNVVVTGTTFNNNLYKGMYFEKLSDALFDGITVGNSGTVGSFAAGIDINLKFTAYQNIEIRNSTITGCGNGDAVNGVGIAVKARDDAPSYNTVPASLANVDLVGNIVSGCRNAIRFGEPGKTNAGPLQVDVHQNQITGSPGFGLINVSLNPTQAGCNWWGMATGPNVPPLNPSPGADGISGVAVWTPWWSSPAGPCDEGDDVTPGPAPSCVSTIHPCITIPVTWDRVDATPARGVSVTFTLSANLRLCSGLASITEGSYLNSVGGTNFQVLDNGGKSYTVDCAILGTPCGATGDGTLFDVAVARDGSDGTGVITVTSVIARDCLNATIGAIPGAPLSITIDTVGPTAVADLAAAQQKTGNDADGTTKIGLTWTPAGDAAVAEVYRAPYGQYPEYDDAGGSVPAAPGYTPAGPWALAATLPGSATGHADEPATRDFWYYVVFLKDACGNVSAVSNRTGGTLDYHLGDVVDPSLANPQDNQVTTADVSLLGAHYGITLLPADPWNALDVGPTTDYSVNARPMTDNRVQFEDLMVFAMNYGQVSAPGRPAPESVGGGRNDLTLDVRRHDGALEAVLNLEASGLKGVSVDLAYDAAVVRPVEVTAGELLSRQSSPSAVFSAKPGNVDAAVLGSGATLSGAGDVAVVRFESIGPGDPGIGIARAEGRDGANRPVRLDGGERSPAATPTGLRAAWPNPFRQAIRLPVWLETSARVRLQLFDVTGRLVRTLVDGELPAGGTDIDWDGRDATGRPAGSGLYLVRLEAGGRQWTQPVYRVR